MGTGFGGGNSRLSKQLLFKKNCFILLEQLELVRNVGCSDVTKLVRIVSKCAMLRYNLRLANIGMKQIS